MSVYNLISINPIFFPQGKRLLESATENSELPFYFPGGPPMPFICSIIKAMKLSYFL